MEHTSKNIQTIAFFFFLVTGSSYLLTSLLSLNQTLLPLSQKLGSALLLPTVLMGLIYGTTSVLDTLASEEKNSRIQIILGGICFALMGATIVIVHFVLPQIKS